MARTSVDPALDARLAVGPLLRPVALDSEAERWRWRCCDLANFAENRLPTAPDPRTLTADAFAAWSERALAGGDRVLDPASLAPELPCWILDRGAPVGTVSAMLWDLGPVRPVLQVSSLYVLPEARRQGLAGRVIDALTTIARELGCGALRLHTDWLWQPALRFYLRRGFLVQNWKHCLVLIRPFDAPAWQLREDDERLTLVACADSGARTGATAGAVTGAPGTTLTLTARRVGERLDWTETPAAGLPPALQFRAWHLRGTLALHLAVRGWPLVRGPAEWAERARWMDAGMPEGLARRLRVWEAWAGKQGFRIDTPRIPGLTYPDWEELLAETEPNPWADGA